jgi:hypothetical protein
MSAKFETPQLLEVGSISNVVLMKQIPDNLDDSSGAQPSTTDASILDVD